jgi:hypothetical protein
MSLTIFAGCSYTSGSGLDSLEKNSPNLWVNLLHANSKILKNTSLLNVSIGGRSNAGIFQDAVYNILRYNATVAIVEWTSVPRYEISTGLELYDTGMLFAPNCSVIRDQNLNDITYSKEYLKKINDRFTTIPDHHYEIVNLVSYVNSLTELCKIKKCKLYFINGLCPWDQDFFFKKNTKLPSDFTEYTQQLLKVNNRNDEEIFKLYQKIHDEYSVLGGIHADNWINLYSSMRHTKVDLGIDKMHPGIESNYMYYKKFLEIINSNEL